MLFINKKKKELIKGEENGIAEDKIMKEQHHKFIKRVGFVISVIILIFLISVLLSIYNNLITINKYLAYTAVVLIVLFFIIFILIPFIKAIKSPIFIVDATNNLSVITRKNYITMKKVAKNLISAPNSIPFEEKELLKEAISDKYKLRDKLKEVYKKYISKDIAKLTFATSSRVACATAVSKNQVFDACTTILANIRLIMQITIKCGYRPSYLRLSKLIIFVLRNAIFAYTLSYASTSEQVSNLAKKLLNNIPIVGSIVGPLLEGVTNGFLTARIGVTTKKYLLNEFELQSKLLEDLENNESIARIASLEAKDLIENA